MVSGANRRHRSARSAIVAVQKVQTRHRVLGQVGLVERLAQVARDVLDDVLAKKRLDVLGHKLSADHKTLVAVDGTLRTELRHHELR